MQPTWVADGFQQLPTEETEIEPQEKRCKPFIAYYLRKSCEKTGLANRRLQPLGHLSNRLDDPDRNPPIPTGPRVKETGTSYGAVKPKAEKPLGNSQK
jgi:hypothetical protein